MKIAVIGATGAVGREMLCELEPTSVTGEAEIAAFASPRSAGMKLPFRDGSLEVQPFSINSLQGFDYALLSAGGEFSLKWSKELARMGVTVIDNSSAWRMDPEVPLIVPEVNLASLTSRDVLIANPNCSTIQLVVSLAPLRCFGLQRVIVSTYQSVSGSGQKGLRELSNQLSAEMRGDHQSAHEVYEQPIAFNILPFVGPASVDGHCLEEEKMVLETKRILGYDQLEVLATSVRVPVFRCHGEAVAVELDQEVSLVEARDAMRAGAGIHLIEDHDPSELPTPRKKEGTSVVWAARLRLLHGESRSRWLQFWNLADNLKKGAATNAVQIMASSIDLRRQAS